MTEQFNGFVRVKDGNKAALDYGVNREVEASISFSTDDQSRLESIVNEAGRIADAKVNELLGRAPKVATPQAANKSPGRPPKAKVEAVAAPTGDVMGVEATKAAAPTADVMNISTGGERNPPQDDVMADVTAPVEPAAVTDQELMSAITKKNAGSKNPLAIRTLIGKYVPQDGNPHQAADIEASKRRAFLTELEGVPVLAQ